MEQPITEEEAQRRHRERFDGMVEAGRALEGLRDKREAAETWPSAKDRKAWSSAGLGFWRLVWIVAFGILIAQGINGAILGLWAVLVR